MEYKTDSSVIRHVVNLLEQICKKYIGQEADLFTLMDAKKILFNLAISIDKGEAREIEKTSRE